MGRMLPPAKKIFGIPHICLDKIRKILYNIFCCFTICDRGGIGIRARLRGVSSNGYGFKSRRSHIFQSREKSRFFHFHLEYQAWHDVLTSMDAPFGTPCSIVFHKYDMKNTPGAVGSGHIFRYLFTWQIFCAFLRLCLQPINQRWPF